MFRCCDVGRLLREFSVDEPLRWDMFVLSWELWLAREDNDSDCLDAVVVMVRKGIVFGGNGAYQDDEMNGKKQSNSFKLFNRVRDSSYHDVFPP